MDLIINIISMALCAGTMTYCYVLGRQVKALRNMRDGFGILIEDMIKTTSNLEHTFDVTKKNMERDYEHLCDKIDEGVALTEYLTMKINELKSLDNQISYSNLPVNTAKTAKKHLDRIFDEQDDPLADVMPKGFSRHIKRTPPSIIPGEEYL